MPQGGALNVMLIQVAINDILSELGRGVDWLLFAGYLLIYTTIRSVIVGASILQGITNRIEV